jgi:hypothetical protein
MEGRMTKGEMAVKQPMMNRLMETLRFLLVLISCTVLSYAAILYLASRLLPDYPYHRPDGEAVKVVHLINAPEPQDLEGYAERLQLFFLTGE